MTCQGGCHKVSSNIHLVEEAMTENQHQHGIHESLAELPIQQKLTRARNRTRASLARKLNVTIETIRRSERRSDLYLSTLSEIAERRGGSIRLEVAFPGQPTIVLSGLSGFSAKNAQKSEPATASNRSLNRGAPSMHFSALLTPLANRYKFKQDKDLFISIRLAETSFQRVK